MPAFQTTWLMMGLSSSTLAVERFACGWRSLLTGGPSDGSVVCHAPHRESVSRRAPVAPTVCPWERVGCRKCGCRSRVYRS